MKMILTVLCMSILAELHAQRNLFDQPHNIKHRYHFNLDNGEKMMLELTSNSQLNSLPYIDSLMQVYREDMRPIIDTIQGEHLGRRIDYVLDGSPVKKIKVKDYQRSVSSYAVSGSYVSYLKTDQDTIVITSLAPNTYRLTFFLNDLTNISIYTNGQLMKKIRQLQSGLTSKWIKRKDGKYEVKNTPSITASSPDGRVAPRHMIMIRPSIDIQNYRNRFVPSVTFAAAFASIKNNRYREIGIGSEMHFRFTDIADSKKTSIHNFITASYARGRVGGTSPFPARLDTYFSLSYLFRNAGIEYPKETFRLGLGRIQLFSGSTKIEPSLYINGFFKSATPSLRLLQTF